MPRVPVKVYEHGTGVDWHETIDDFDSHAKSVGTVGQSFHDRVVSDAERKRWKRDDAEREKRRRPAGFAPWPD